MIKQLKRRFSTAGNRPIVCLPTSVLEQVKAKVGDEVEIYTEGKRMTLEPIELEPEEEKVAL